MSLPWRERAALTIAEAAELLSVSPVTVRRRFGEQLVRIGTSTRVPVRAVLEALGEVEPSTDHELRDDGPEATSTSTSRQAERIVEKILGGVR